MFKVKIIIPYAYKGAMLAFVISFFLLPSFLLGYNFSKASQLNPPSTEGIAYETINSLLLSAFPLYLSHSLAINPEGNALFSWYTTDPSFFFTIQASQKTSTATSWTNSELIGSQNDPLLYPTIALNNQGSGIITWIDSFSNYNVYVSTRDAHNTWAAPIALSTDNTSYNSIPAINNNGLAAVVWTSGSNNIYSSARNPQTGIWETGSLISASNDGFAPVIAIDDLGTMVVIWSGIDTNIYTSTRSGFNGTWSAPTALSTTSTTLSKSIFSNLAMNGQGQAVATWLVAEDSTNITGLYASIRSSSGIWSAPTLLYSTASTSTLFPYCPTVNINASGTIVIGWGTYDSSSSISFIGTSVYTNGTWQSTILDSFAIDPNDGGAPSFVAVNDQGILGATWTTNTKSIVISMKIGNGAWSAPMQLDTTPSTQNQSALPILTMNNNLALVVWGTISNNLFFSQASIFNSAQSLKHQITNFNSWKFQKGKVD